MMRCTRKVSQRAILRHWRHTARELVLENLSSKRILLFSRIQKRRRTMISFLAGKTDATPIVPQAITRPRLSCPFLSGGNTRA
jgi:hypothetical protein